MFLIVVVSLALLVPACRQEAPPERPHAAAASLRGGVSDDLLELREEYDSRGQSQTGEFVPSNSALKLIGDRVVVDAVAADDGAALGRELETIGASDVSVVGRNVSAQLPIDSIGKLEGLPNLKYARASYAQAR